MPTASHLRAQIEATLAERIPSALTPMARVAYPVAPTGIPEIDLLLHGGFPVGALSEVVGPECSGRTSLALAFVAGMTQSGKVCAWVDVSDTLHPESAAAMGVHLSRLLWVRCGSSPVTVPLPAIKRAPRSKSWARLEQALRVTDLLLQAGGFSCIVLDMGSLNAEYALRVPLATWFRFRAAAERLQSNVLLLTQHACSRNSAGLVLRLEPGSVLAPDSTIFTGLERRAELARQRFPQSPGNVFPMRSTAGPTAGRGRRDRKQPQSVQTTQWQGRTLWAGRS
jgi:recombination protein RecA